MYLSINDNCVVFVCVKCLQCHRIHRTLASQFKYALVWVSKLQFDKLELASTSILKRNDPLLILNQQHQQLHIDTNMDLEIMTFCWMLFKIIMEIYFFF